jgi:ParB family chromosome partitioning protein
MITTVSLTTIKDNPWQPRQSMDAAALKDLAENIRQYGLMQKPVARAVNEHYELAIGHRRVEACRLLEMTEIEIDVLDLTDREMFERAVSENLQRKDLNPVEVAAAMKRYMEEFQATSEQCGTFFGVAGATVRGNVRLLDLPETVKSALAESKITVGAARHLLTMQKLLPVKMDEALKEIVKGEEAEEVVNHHLSRGHGNALDQ